MTKSEILKKTHKNVIKCRLLTIMDLKGDPKSWGHPEQPFWSPVAIYNHLASTDYPKAVNMSLKVSKIHSKSDKFKPSQQSQPIPATSTNPSKLNRISKKTNQTMFSNTL